MQATQELKTEHGAVLIALKLLDKITEAIAEESRQAADDLERLLDFFRGFVDECHHGKEEDVLFPELERRGLEREESPIGVLLTEHEIGRKHVRGLAAGLERWRRGDTEAAAAIREHALAYRETLLEHIRKESDELFPVADRLVPDAAAAALVEQYDEIERERVGAGKHEAYHALLHELRDRYGVG